MEQRLRHLEDAIATLQSARGQLGDAVVDLALAPLQAELAALRGAQARQQLRQVSVLFLDVVGFTGWADRLDPEDLQALIDASLAAFSTVVARHGGRVLQYAGDSLLAVFGADGAVEAHAEQAVRAGLALLEAALAQSARLRPHPGAQALAVRVGVHSGEVLLGGGVDGDRSIRGAAVNIAARMEQTAPAGQLRISQDTWRLVRGQFEASEQPLLQVKGRDAPMRTWLVHRSLARAAGAQRGVDGVVAPMLGREAAWAALQQALDRAPGGLQWLTVVGEAGIGKSRLLREFSAWLAEHQAEGCCLTAQGAERRSREPYGLLRDLVGAALPHLASVASADLPDVWLAEAASVLGHRSDAAVLGHLLGMDFGDEPAVRALAGDARLLRDRAFFHAAQLLRARARPERPLVLLLDDLHWADDGSLDFVEHLARSQAGLPALMVGLARPVLLERRPAWAGAQGGGLRIDLPALDEGLGRQLLHSLLRRLPSVPDALCEAILSVAEGNPFFIEELVNMLIDQGTIDCAEGAWQLQPVALAQLRLPGTLTGVLQSRLDALPAAERRVLQLAAVAGAVFWDDALAALQPWDGADGGPRPVLQALAERGLVLPRPHSRVGGTTEYAFRHHTLHRVCYDSVLKRVKQPAHRAMARWLAARPGAPLPEQIAEHHERGDEPDLAREAWQRAAEAASARFALADAQAHARRALALTAPDDLPRRLALQLLCLTTFDLQADTDRAADCLAELHGLAERLGDDGWRSEVLARQARWHFDRGDAAEALALAERSSRLAPPADRLRAARAEWVRMMALLRLGQIAEGQASAHRTLRLAQAAGAVQMAASVRNELGSAAFDAGDIGAALEHYQAALALHRADGHLANEGGTLCNLAFAALATGDFDAARQQFEQAGALCRQVGQRHSEAIIETNLGLALLHLAQPDLAAERARLALDLLRPTGDRWGEAAAWRVAGLAALAQGRHPAARQALAQSRDLLEGLGLPHLALEAMAGLVEEALARDDRAAALAEAEQILARRAAGVGLQGTDEPLRIPLATWRALQAVGDPRAPAVLAQAAQELRQRAERIGDAALRARFISAVPHHRAIAAAAAGGTDRATG